MAIGTPRLVIAGLSGDSGKTIVSLSLLTALRQKGLSISVFKKGPDYIDAAWLGKASGTICRNLDTYLVDSNDVYRNFVINSIGSDITIIEGNRGLFDGKDTAGTHSTASLARLLGAPIILVIDVTKATRTIAALIKGCLDFESGLNIAGVILNNIASERHKKIIAESVKTYCNLPILGAVPKLTSDDSIIPGRHLGLVPPTEIDSDTALDKKLAQIAEQYLDLKALLEIAASAEPVENPEEIPSEKAATKVKVGYFRDSVFTFYYPENLEALKRAGADVVRISSVEDKHLPDVDALYIGGGFPETQADKLAENKSMQESVKLAAENGIPIYAECGGLIYLSRSIKWKDNCYPMTGLFPIDLQMHDKPVGHGYTRLRVDKTNPFYKTGDIIKGHEFHYSGPVLINKNIDDCMEVQSGFGLGKKRDGLVFKNTLACYTHIHADGVKDWAPVLVEKALKYKCNREDDEPRNFRGKIAKATMAA